MTVAVTAFGERVDHVAPGFIVDRIAVVAFAGSKHRRKFLAALITPAGVDLITGAGGEGQAIDYIGSHERIGLVIFPPTPAAVIVLIGIQAVQATLHLLIQIV